MNQTLPVIYQEERFLVDPSLLAQSSLRFQELISTNQNSFENIQLKITNNQFTVRNVSNFLKICQNQQTDVQNSELEEILSLAIIFKSEQIYNMGLNFIHQSIDPNYTVPSQLFNQTESLILKSQNENSHFQNVDVNELEFDDSCDVLDTSKIEDNKDNNQNEKKKKKHSSTFYQITSDNPMMKCQRYYLKKDNQILYMAKIKNDEIYIGEGSNFHISENKFENTAKIKRDCQGYNIVNTDDQEFKIKFLKYGNKHSLSASFYNNGSKLSWRPKEAKNSNSYNGEFHHQPIPSNKNIILQNPRNHSTFILRKMSKKSYEAECHPGVKPIIAFAISLSQILGPASL
ncbi:hypothetical protein M9Y10_041219 [Tritrichomonas musculus]|uniref:Tubby C-terminal domain-containing protein n=1 Tax=Tritrichomonas musculus TaxID=1915356 RepID=A0ABR2K3Q7_9EUKA